jgi:hypothetical protein
MVRGNSLNLETKRDPVFSLFPVIHAASVI